MKKYKLYGAILGDLAGQPYEYPPMKHFPKNVDIHNHNAHITDDTLMTLATAKAMLDNTYFEYEYKDMAKRYYDNKYYYGDRFIKWVKEPIGVQYDSYGNGCLMRISPIIYASYNAAKMIYKSCVCSHNHPISIESCLELNEMYNGMPLRDISKPVIFDHFNIKADETLEFVKQVYNYSNSTHDAITMSVRCGGDTDTNASIVGELCNYKYNDLTEKDADYVESKLDDYLLNILKTFNNKF